MEQAASKPRIVDDEITLVPYYPNSAVTLAWYQDPDVCKQVDNMKWQDTMSFIPLPDHAPRPDSSLYRYDLNVLQSFDIHRYTLTPHPEETYRADELRTMIRLCKERGVDIVFVVGPYNQIAYSKVYPSEVANIQKVSTNILKVLKEEGAAHIDCTDLSTIPGTFDDWQHHSSYGAYLIYQKIKEYVLEKESH